MTDQAAKATTPKRALRMCDVCGQVDDHPRHVFGHGPDGVSGDGEAASKALAAVGGDADAVTAIIEHIRDDATTMRHMDCCRDAGCPDGTCTQVTAGAEDKTGDDLVAHLTKGN